MAFDRALFIDQSQSMNVHVAAPDYQLLTSLHFQAWKNGLKTGMYYFCTMLTADPIQFTVDKSKANTLVLGDHVTEMYMKSLDDHEVIDEKDLLKKLSIKGQLAMCSLVNKEGCESCQG